MFEQVVRSMKLLNEQLDASMQSRACPKIRKIGPTSGPGPGGRPENVEGDDFRASIGGIQGRSKAA